MTISTIVGEIHKQVIGSLHQSLYLGNHERSKYHNYKRMRFSQINEYTLQVSSNSGNKGVQIEYDPAFDLYNVHRYKITRKLEVKIDEKVCGIYVEQMLEYVKESF